MFHRAVEGAGCIYCEKAFLKELPYLLVTMYAKQYGLATRTDDEKLIGARIDAVIPELRLAFAFSQKGTDREAKVEEVLRFLCKAKRIQLFVIRQKDPIALATEIKQAFAKANLGMLPIFGSDTLLKRTMETKKRNCDLQFLLVLLIRFYCMGKQHIECVLLCSLISFS